MKNKIACFVVLLSILCLSACGNEHAEPGIDSMTANAYMIEDGVKYKIIVIDGCEYIYGWDNGAYNGGYFLAHKGNCKNSLHQKNIQTITDTVEYKLIRESKQ